MTKVMKPNIVNEQVLILINGRKININKVLINIIMKEILIMMKWQPNYY